MAKQKALNDAEFDELDNEARAQIEGYRAGCYVRLEIHNVPCELVEHFDPRFPIIVGGLLGEEERFGYVTVRIKRTGGSPVSSRPTTRSSSRSDGDGSSLCRSITLTTTRFGTECSSTPRSTCTATPRSMARSKRPIRVSAPSLPCGRHTRLQSVRHGCCA